MKLMPIIFVTDMDRSADFFEVLGGTVGPGGRSAYWTEMELGGAEFALHVAEPIDAAGSAQRMGVSLVADRALEEIRADLAEAGVEVCRDIADEAFGRSMIISDPDGLPLQINEHDAELHPT